ncbi:hypothetical protein [Bradyrhizobium guangxiense]|uniref:hypothetical protein n=1 Tax=Bradyrhizobium guangxiense TaxID=1325115 RepID=UPI001008BB80|nr:hypothetical protein [Bradyrhizobium guangxiense]
MPRRIREFSLQAAGGQPGGAADGYLDKVVKYVPADIIAAWTAIAGVLRPVVGTQPATGAHLTLLVICFLIVMGVAYWWTLKATAEAGQPPATKQAIVAVIAFVVWVLALGDLQDALKLLSWWDIVYAKVILILFTLISGKL